MNLTDKQLTCTDCGSSFLFTIGEQQFFASKGLTNEPRRCPACRSARRMHSAQESTSSTGSSAAPRPAASQPTFAALCAQYGRAAELPFQPQTGKPVYCTACYRQRRGLRDASDSRFAYR
jgi:CxxC-x17-CxxC domain-containing protein